MRDYGVVLARMILKVKCKVAMMRLTVRSHKHSRLRWPSLFAMALSYAISLAPSSLTARLRQNEIRL